MNIVQQSIYQLLTTDYTNEEISQIIGGISSYTIGHYRRMLGLKKYAGKSLEKIINLKLKEFYSLLQIERDTLKKIRSVIKLLLLTDKTNDEIDDEVGSSILLTKNLRKVLMLKKCDWQKIKAMSDEDLKILIKTKCPQLKKIVFPHVDFRERRMSRRNILLRDIWREYTLDNHASA